MTGRRSLALAVVAGAAFLAALTAGSAQAADECKGLRVCLPVAGPWVVIPAGGIDYELACPVQGYVVAGTDGSPSEITFRVLDTVPTAPEDLALKLIEKGCTAQLDVLSTAMTTADG